MSQTPEKTRFQLIREALQDHPVIAVLLIIGLVVVSLAAFTTALGTLRSNLSKMLGLRDSSVKVVDISVFESEKGQPIIDFTLRNTGQESVVVKGVKVDVLDSVELQPCAAVPESALLVSGEYNLLLAHNDRTMKRVKVSQMIPPNGADRFSLIVDSSDVDTIFHLRLGIVYNEDSSFLDCGEVVLFFDDLLALDVPQLYPNEPLDSLGSISGCVARNISLARPFLKKEARQNYRASKLLQRISSIERHVALELPAVDAKNSKEVRVEVSENIPQAIKGELEEVVPFVVRIAAKGPADISHRHICGGTLIRSDRVITAAHCLFNRRTGRLLLPEELEIVLHDNRSIDIARFEIPDYTFSGEGTDFAVLSLVGPITP